MSFKNLSISTRLSAAFVLLTLLLLAVAAGALFQMGQLRSATVQISENWLPSVEAAALLNLDAAKFRLREVRHVLAETTEAKAAIEKEMVSVKAAFDDRRLAYEKLINGVEERKVYDTLTAELQDYASLHMDVLNLSNGADLESARALLEGNSQESFNRQIDLLQKLVALNHRGSEVAAQVSASAYAMARNTMIGAALLAVLLASVLAVRLIRSVTGPLRVALDAANRVANGDLSGRIEATSSDEAGQLLEALNRMQDSLVRTVSGVRGNAESVATASSQIAQGNSDLSQRTEQQAAALEETAATMDQLGATVRNNADNARQANQLALGASGVAERGGAVVGQVVDTMKGINTSSRKIADIITTIDGIAFQTNILALNAAVEAARAGEQGRGFAVVASEVRILAQRSAEAAKEIKSLITASVEQVELGTTLVDQAGHTMNEIVSAIQRVTDIVAEISSASSEQSSGVTQVGQAITQMDQATQQNAALVEQSAAAAESLKGQARAMVDAVAVFRLNAVAEALH